MLLYLYRGCSKISWHTVIQEMLIFCSECNLWTIISGDTFETLKKKQWIKHRSDMPTCAGTSGQSRLDTPCPAVPFQCHPIPFPASTAVSPVSIVIVPFSSMSACGFSHVLQKASDYYHFDVKLMSKPVDVVIFQQLRFVRAHISNMSDK